MENPQICEASKVEKYHVFRSWMNLYRLHRFTTLWYAWRIILYTYGVLLNSDGYPEIIRKSKYSSRFMGSNTPSHICRMKRGVLSRWVDLGTLQKPRWAMRVDLAAEYLFRTWNATKESALCFYDLLCIQEQNTDLKNTNPPGMRQAIILQP